MARAQDLGHYKNVLFAIESLINSMKDVNLKPLSERHLLTNYIHPFIQCLIGSDEMTVAHGSDTTADNEELSFDKRSDHITDVYEQFEFSHPQVFGEIKAERAQDLSKIIDFYRLGVLGKQAIEDYSLNGVILFQSIGKYYMINYSNTYSSTNFQIHLRL